MLTRAMSILCRHEPEDVVELELDAEFQAQRTTTDPVRVKGRLYETAKTFYFSDGSALSVVEDQDGGFVVAADKGPRSMPIGSHLH